MENKDKWTKRDVLSALGFFAIIGALIVVVFFTGRSLGIPEFM